MVDKQYLLNSKQMATFVARGFLRFDELVPPEINEAFMGAAQRGDDPLPVAAAGTPISKVFTEPSSLTSLMQLPQIQGIIHSLVGPDPLLDHHVIHLRQPNEGGAQYLHCDAIFDPRTTHFDIQLMYFPHRVPYEMGGTLLIPGSHFRRINEMEIARYQNMLGQIQMVCGAGSILVLHHGIWHCGRQNQTEHLRRMYKIRLNPVVQQRRLWNTDDLDESAHAHGPLHSPATAKDGIQAILSEPEPWFENGTSRLEIVNRSKLWRYLTGDDDFAAHYWLTRIENEPTALA